MKTRIISLSLKTLLCVAVAGLFSGCSTMRPIDDAALGAGGAYLGVSDLVLQQGVELGGFAAGVAEAAADGFDGHPGVDQFGGVGVANSRWS